LQIALGEFDQSQPGRMLVLPWRQILPARYNVRSELAFTVSDGHQQKDFALKSK
jgi:hypothetical protein